MLRLAGFRISNYHNKVRLALLEKGVAFEEDAERFPSQKPDWLERSPMGKVPILELDGGRRLAESQVICEYLEDAYPEKPLYPRDPFKRESARADRGDRASCRAAGPQALRHGVLRQAGGRGDQAGGGARARERRARAEEARAVRAVHRRQDAHARRLRRVREPADRLPRHEGRLRARLPGRA